MSRASPQTSQMIKKVLSAAQYLHKPPKSSVISGWARAKLPRFTSPNSTASKYFFQHEKDNLFKHPIFSNYLKRCTAVSAEGKLRRYSWQTQRALHSRDIEENKSWTRTKRTRIFMVEDPKNPKANNAVNDELGKENLEELLAPRCRFTFSYRHYLGCLERTGTNV